MGAVVSSETGCTSVLSSASGFKVGKKKEWPEMVFHHHYKCVSMICLLYFATDGKCCSKSTILAQAKSCLKQKVI